MPKPEARTITIGITGASGAVYAQKILRLLDADRRVARVYLVTTEAGLRLLSTELGIVAADGKKLPALLTGTPAKKIEYLQNKDIGASIASGSAIVDGMAVIPCSAGALGSIATGIANDLLSRAADVCLKERRPLVLCLARNTAQSHSPRKHGSRPRRRCYGDARHARVLLRTKIDRRSRRAIYVSRSRAARPAAGKAISLEGRQALEFPAAPNSARNSTRY